MISEHTKNLELIGRWADHLFIGGDPAWLDEVTRFSARGILLDDLGRVAMMYMSKDHRYKLPGGGMEPGEEPSEAFLREIREETGWEAEIVKLLGYCEEHKNKNHFMQRSYVFLARAVKDHQDVALTANETKLGMMMQWMLTDQAIAAMEQAIATCVEYSSQFMLARDRAILAYAATWIENKGGRNET